MTTTNGATVDRGEFIGRDALTAWVCSTRDQRIRSWPLVQFLVKPT